MLSNSRVTLLKLAGMCLRYLMTSTTAWLFGNVFIRIFYTVPLRDTKIRDKSLIPWINSFVRKEMNMRYKLLKDAKLSCDPEQWNCTFQKVTPLHRTNTLDMRSITRCFCSCTVWTSALWGQGSGRADSFKMVTLKRARRAEAFCCNLERDVLLKAGKIRQKIRE